MVPVLVPFTNTLTPIMGSPSDCEVTDPVTGVLCIGFARNVVAESNIHKSNIRLLK